MKAMELISEAWATARAARGFTWFTAILVTVVVIIIQLTTGVVEAQRLETVALFTDGAYRTAAIIDNSGEGLLVAQDQAMTAKLSNVETAWLESTDFAVHNAAMVDHGAGSARFLMGDWAGLPIDLISGRWPTSSAEALLPVDVAQRLGFGGQGGAIVAEDGRQWAVVGHYASRHDRAPNSIIIPAPIMTPQTMDGGLGSDEPRWHALSLTVRELPQLSASLALARSLLGPVEPTDLAIERSDDAAGLSRSVQSSFIGFAEVITVGALVAAAILLAIVALMMGYARRQELGRRRALGASQLMIVTLILLQETEVVILAGLAGLAIGAGVSWRMSGVAPQPLAMLALLVAVTCGSALAQLPAAVAAGWRDPVRVLRTP
ncbi:MAG: hypothetical protein LBV30_08725 [Propionibacteriaceae bacterium]|jgi:putative ABC transport system permease protein|nr:hypothetical protein [Propionibacteriaceae bacterium]